MPTRPLQLTSKTPETYLDLADDDDSLKQLGFANGQMVGVQFDFGQVGALKRALTTDIHVHPCRSFASMKAHEM